jgi:hypothetical protein
MKKILKIGAILVVMALIFMNENISEAANTDQTNIYLGVSTTISIDCTPTVTMNTITGYGFSTLSASNEAECVIQTNNSTGYSVTWQASTAWGTNNGALENASSDEIPTLSTTPAVWNVANGASGWGARVKSTSQKFATNTSTAWGSTDTYAGIFAGINTSAIEFWEQASETGDGGSDLTDNVTIQFGAEIDSAKIQPTGTYRQEITLTATTL